MHGFAITLHLWVCLWGYNMQIERSSERYLKLMLPHTVPLCFSGSQSYSEHKELSCHVASPHLISPGARKQQHHMKA